MKLHISHDGKFKKLILKWLASITGTEYEHSYSDTFMHWTIFYDELKISLDKRQENQSELFNALPDKYKGTISSSGVLVNTDSLYFRIDEIVQGFEYPSVSSYKFIDKIKHQECEKGWYIKGSYWYEYVWEVTLSNNMSFIHKIQESDKFTIDVNSYTFRTRVHELLFEQFIRKNFN